MTEAPVHTSPLDLPEYLPTALDLVVRTDLELADQGDDITRRLFTQAVVGATILQLGRAFQINTASGTNAAPAETDGLQKPKFRFVFCAHVPENAAAIAKAMEDCDVLAIECVTSDETQEERETLEAACNRLMASDLTDEERENIEKAHSEKYPYLFSLLAQFERNGKQVKLVDLEPSDPQSEGVMQNIYEHCLLVYNAVNTDLPNQEIRKAVIAAFQYMGGTSRMREKKVVKQLQKIADITNPGKKIGVMAGTSHTPIHHQLSRQGYSSDTVFAMGNLGALPDKPGGGPEKARFPYFDQAARAYNHNLPISPALIDRIILQKTYAQYNFGSGANLDEAECRIQADLLDHMPDEVISKLLTELDERKTGCRSMLPGYSTYYTRQLLHDYYQQYAQAAQQ